MVGKNILRVLALMAFIIFSVSSQELEFEDFQNEPEILQLQEDHIQDAQQEKKRNLQIGGCIREWSFCYSGGPACCTGLTCNFVKQICHKVQK
jgi:hypothetical protein